MPKKDAFLPGEFVTCIHAVEAYYSRVAGKPEIWFNPGMRGIIASIAPKVKVVYNPPITDNKDIFLVVDFRDNSGKVQRVGLNFCNAKAMKEEHAKV